MCSRYLGSTPLLLADPDTWSAAAISFEGARLIFPCEPHADEVLVQEAREALRGKTGALAVGSGTINDICKRACALEGLPFVVLGTAASMNGYASAIAAILSQGLKVTLPSPPARAIILDTEITATAPPRLTQAGLGDLLSKALSDSDWWLGHRILGEHYSALPSRLTDRAMEEACAQAAGLRTGSIQAYEALSKALILSGVAMVLAGSSSPASGGEHLLSHLLDMEAHHYHRPLHLHGAQVGIASSISAALYQRLLRLRRPQLKAAKSWAQEEARIREELGSLAPAALAQAQKKHERAEERRDTLREHWSEIRESLEERNLPSPIEIQAPLRAAGAPYRLKDLGLSFKDGARLLRSAADIRSRFTVLDLARDLNILPREIDAVLEEAGV